jgi:hypothetical protein
MAFHDSMFCSRHEVLKMLMLEDLVRAIGLRGGDVDV